MSVTPEQLRAFQANRIAVERELGARSLYEFFKLCWHQIEPNRFIDNWHIPLLCQELQDAACRVNRNLVIAIPPRHGKSLLVSVAFPAWVWTWWPSAKFITGSYERNLATRDALTTRRLVMSDWYQERWGHTTRIAEDQGQKTYYQTTAGGHRFITTPTSAVTGYGGDFIMADDPHNVVQGESEADRETAARWWFEAIPSRLDRPDDGVKIIIQQRIHELDLAGQAMKRGYHKVVMPAIYEADHPDIHPKDPRAEGEPLWPARMSLKTVNALARDMGTYAAAGQLQQRPAPREGGMFQRRWFQIMEDAPSEAKLNTVRKWDLAATVAEAGKDPDWTVGVKMGRDELGRFWILDVQRFQATAAQVQQAMKAIASSDGLSCTIGIPEDPGQAGKAQVQYLTGQLAPYPVRAERESGDKVRRAEPLSAQCEVGNVFLVRGHWNEAFLHELEAFPNAAHDDQVDATAGAFRLLAMGGMGMLDWIRQQAQAYENPIIGSTEEIVRIRIGG